jgi:hypothetical protein
MKHSMLKSRKGKLKNSLNGLIDSGKLSVEDIDFILYHIDKYEKNNLETIKKLKKQKKTTIKNGGLKQTINAHGPITKELIGSASKRIYGLLMTTNNQFNKKRYIGLIRVGVEIILLIYIIITLWS